VVVVHCMTLSRSSERILEVWNPFVRPCKGLRGGSMLGLPFLNFIINLMLAWFCFSFVFEKITVQRSCILCLHDLIRVRYFGEREFCTDETSPNFRRSFWSPMVEGGVNVWVAKDEAASDDFRWRKPCKKSVSSSLLNVGFRHGS